MTIHSPLEDKASKFTSAIVRNLSSRGIYFVYLKILIDLCNRLNNECGFLFQSPEWMMLLHFAANSFLSALLMIFKLNLLGIILDSGGMEKWHYLKSTTFFIFLFERLDNCYNVIWWTARRLTTVLAFKSSEFFDPAALQAFCQPSWPFYTCHFLWVLFGKVVLHVMK